MGRGRTHHQIGARHQTKSEDQSKRPTIAMDYHLKDELGGECSNNIRRISILGKEDRHRTEVAVKGVKPSNGLIENTVMFLHGNHQNNQLSH